MQPDGKAELLADSSLSFKPFLDFLRAHLQDKSSVKKELFAFVLDRFESYEGINDNIQPADLPKYKDLLDLLYVVLTNLTEDEKQLYWGMCAPMSPTMFYGSDLFYDILEHANAHDLECGMEAAGHKEFLESKLELFYAYILERFYDIRVHTDRNLVRTMKDNQSGFTRHFSLNINNDFVEVTAKSKLPQIDTEILRRYAFADNTLENLQKLLPVNMFSFSGFSILTITDITHQYALETIRDNIVKNQAYSAGYHFPHIVQALKELTGSNAIEFNVLPFFQVNGKMLQDIDSYSHSTLFSLARQQNMTEEACFNMIEKFLSKPELFYYTDPGTGEAVQHETAAILQAAGIASYMLVPVFYNKKIVGAIEAYSREKDLLSERTLARLEPAKQLLAQLMYNNLLALEAEIETVIKEKYTRLQPAVQWKFNEAAWHHIQAGKKQPSSKPEAEEISFKNVYPLYGAVDIRNSTIERNAAMIKDYHVQFDILLTVLQQLKNKTGFGLLDEKIYAATRWAGIVKNSDQHFNRQVSLNDFLENNIMPFLIKFTDQRPELLAIADAYFNCINEATGTAFENRRQLESSMTRVIAAVNNYFDNLKNEIQQAYPCYFEKFRTDGVEYDIYIGQSISPGQPYSDIYLKNLRLMQLTSMAAIAKYTHALLPALSNAVETTQLIFIHSQPIDILFRNDEKRFDVEGAYNIRYHIIKKRIDKVHLKNSDERLTQPGKIALVYFSEKEAEEYISYIRYLQDDAVLNEDLEKLELEELSGVSGLKALRVGVNLKA